MTPEELALRRTGIGGSDIAAIVGENPHRSAIDVYLDKRGEGVPFEGNERTKWGNVLEPVVAAEYAEREGCAVLLPKPKTWRHPDRAWHLGSPDRLCVTDPDPGVAGGASPSWWQGVTGGWGLEIKTHGKRAGAAYEDGIPPAIELQVRWYQALLECARYDLAALIDTADFRVYRLERDLEVEGYLLGEAEKWWTRHIVEGIAPDPDGSPSFARYLRQRFRSHDTEVVSGDGVVLEALAQHKVATAEIKAAERQKELAAQIIQAAIGEHLGVKAGDLSATWKEQRTAPNYKQVAEELAEAHGVSAETFEALKEAAAQTTRVLRVK